MNIYISVECVRLFIETRFFFEVNDNNKQKPDTTTGKKTEKKKKQYLGSRSRKVLVSVRKLTVLAMYHCWSI